MRFLFPHQEVLTAPEDWSDRGPTAFPTPRRGCGGERPSRTRTPRTRHILSPPMHVLDPDSDLLSALADAKDVDVLTDLLSTLEGGDGRGPTGVSGRSSGGSEEAGGDRIRRRCRGVGADVTRQGRRGRDGGRG